MPEFMDFGKHTPYVLSAFTLTMIILLANVVAARRRLDDRLTRARRRFASEDSQ
jgi:heme exporter protein CcmD